MLWTVALYFMACILGNILDVTGILRNSSFKDCSDYKESKHTDHFNLSFLLRNVRADRITGKLYADHFKTFWACI